MPNDFAETAEGTLLIADGFGPVLAWDGFDPTARKAGVPKPPGTPAMAFSGVGAIIGTYRAFMRYLDSRGRPGALSPVSLEVVAYTAVKAVTAATSTSPIVLTTVGHGLATGVTLKVSDVGGQTGANGVFTITVLDADTFSLDGSFTSGTYTGGGSWLSGAEKVTYSNVGTIADNRVARRQILRNTDGQQAVFYVDVDTTDLGSATLVSRLTDDELSGNEAVPILDDFGKSLLDANSEPVSYKPFVRFHQGLVFLAGEVEYTEGAAAVTFGSATVRGVGTEWTEAAAGRKFYVVGGDKPYDVLAVDVAEQTLTLTESYAAATNPYAFYGLLPPQADGRTVYYSQPGNAEGFSALDAFTLPIDGDQITGLMSKSSFLFILERRHVYRYTFQVAPVRDGSLFPNADRGCVNHRCCVIVEDTAYMLDELGIHRFDGPQDDRSVSDPIQTYFRQDLAGPKINFNASRFFHAVLDAGAECILWFVALSGQYLPRHALVYYYKLDRWATEEYPFPVGSSFSGGFYRRAPLSAYGAGRRQVFLGATARRVLARSASPLDAVDPHAGDTLLAVASSSTRTLTLAAPLTANLAQQAVGAPVVVARGRGAGQCRLVASASGTALALDRPWAVRPDATSVVQVGGFAWSWKSGWFRYADEQGSNARRVTVCCEPVTTDQRLTLRRYHDRSPVPVPASVGRAQDGVVVLKDSGDVEFRLRLLPSAEGDVRFDAGRDRRGIAPSLVSLGLSGVAGEEAVVIHQLTFEGAEAAGSRGGRNG